MLESAAAAARFAERAQAQAHHENAVKDWEHIVVQALSRVTDYTERRMRARADFAAATGHELMALKLAPLSDAEIAQWFIRNAQTGPTGFDIGAGLFGFRKRASGWVVAHGSTAMQDLPHGDEELGSISILTDARVRYRHSFTPAAGERISERGMRDLLKLAGARPLDVPPRP